MKNIFLVFAICISNTLFSQKIEGYEIGVDGFFSASTLGGLFGFGPKFGLRMNENFIFGPSVRYQRSWSKNFGTNYAYNIYGGGVFFHARYKNIVYGGAEFEYLKSPITYSVINSSTSWVPTLFLCAGYSQEFKETIRINFGLYYDVINSDRSPFRPGYFLASKDANGQIVKYFPVIYRLSFFFRLGK